jgi:hypothetical protein
MYGSFKTANYVLADRQHYLVSAPSSPDSDKSTLSRKKPVDFVPGVPDPRDDSAKDSPSDSPDEARGYHTADERDPEAE